jgi:hypothetical protein
MALDPTYIQVPASATATDNRTNLQAALLYGTAEGPGYTGGTAAAAYQPVTIELDHHGQYTLPNTGAGLRRPPTGGKLIIKGNRSQITSRRPIGLHLESNDEHMKDRFEMYDTNWSYTGTNDGGYYANIGVADGGGFQGPFSYTAASANAVTAIRLDNHGFSHIEGCDFLHFGIGIQYRNVQGVPGDPAKQGFSEVNTTERIGMDDVLIPLDFYNTPVVAGEGGSQSYARHRHRDWHIFQYAYGIHSNGSETADPANDRANTYDHVYEGWTALVGGIDGCTFAEFGGNCRSMRLHANLENAAGTGTDLIGVRFRSTAVQIETGFIDLTTTHTGWNSPTSPRYLINNTGQQTPRHIVTSLHVPNYISTNMAAWSLRNQRGQEE